MHPLDVLAAMPGHIEVQRNGGRPMMQVRFLVKLGQSLVDIDKEIPIGDTTEETWQHVEALVLQAGRECGQRLIADHFSQRAYTLGLDAEDEA